MTRAASRSITALTPGDAEPFVELPPADDAVIGGKPKEMRVPPARVTAQDVEACHLHRRSPVAIDFTAFWYRMSGSHFIFSHRFPVRQGKNRGVTGAPPEFRAPCREPAPLGRVRVPRLPLRRTRRAQRVLRSCSCAAGAAASQGSAIQDGRSDNRSGALAGSPHRRGACPNCRHGIGCTTGSADLAGGGTARCPNRRTAAARRRPARRSGARGTDERQKRSARGGLRSPRRMVPNPDARRGTG